MSKMDSVKPVEDDIEARRPAGNRHGISRPDSRGIQDGADRERRLTKLLPNNARRHLHRGRNPPKRAAGCR